jgi:hypothetical protein
MKSIAKFVKYGMKDYSPYILKDMQYRNGLKMYKSSPINVFFWIYGAKLLFNLYLTNLNIYIFTKIK